MVEPPQRPSAGASPEVFRKKHLFPERGYYKNNTNKMIKLISWHVVGSVPDGDDLSVYDDDVDAARAQQQLDDNAEYDRLLSEVSSQADGRDQSKPRHRYSNQGHLYITENPFFWTNIASSNNNLILLLYETFGRSDISIIAVQ